jgi:carotenoid cleavage dioxygenase
MTGISRRELLIGSGAGLLATLAPLRGWASTADPVRDAFAAALAERPWLLAFANVERDAFAAPAELVHGALPPGLSGSLYRNGPAQHEVAGQRYHHSFDGDGLVQAFRLSGGKVRHQARLIETRKLRMEREAGRRLTPGFGTPPPPDRLASNDNRDMNAANISVLWHADRLLALWEGGDAYALEPGTLATVGAHHWSAETAGMPFSAHPRREPDGTLWNFGSIPWMAKLAVYHISREGRIVRVQLIDLPHPGMIHDFLVTERHLVFLIPPLLYERESDAQTFLGRHAWHGEEPLRILLVDKGDLARQTWLEAPASFVFHLGNAWEEPGGAIHLDFCRHPNADLVFGALRRVMWGESVANEPATVTRMTIDPKSRRAAEDIGVEIAEFPSVDPRLVGRRQRYVTTLGRRDGPEAGYLDLNAVVRHDLEDGGTASFAYPASVIPEEHVFVPAAADGAGWIVGTALDYERRATQLAVFEADRLAEGPVALARLPYWLPVGLHGRFVAS